MKKYNRVIAGTIVIYVLLSILTGVFFVSKKGDENTFYKVEINRLYHSYRGSHPKITKTNTKYVKKVYFLPKETEGKEKIANDENEFWMHTENENTVIKPWYDKGKCTGYLCFVYQLPDNTWQLFLGIEVIIFFIEGCVLLILFWIQKNVLKPFHQLQEYPRELAKGHLNQQVKEEQGRYFGDFIRGIGMLRDSLATSKKRELTLLKEKKTILLSLSHDIKTPLNTIRLYQKALEKGLYDEKEKETQALEQIGKKVEEIEAYVENIIHTAKSDIIDIQVNSTDFYLKDLMEGFLENYREKCNMRYTTLKVEEYQNILLHGDKEKGIEVLENLFENAFKYGDGRKIEISFCEEEFCQLIKVFNTGDCVSENDFNHLFESFYRGGNSEGKAGNGLGLYICRELMNKMGGEIFAEICEDGMAFTLVFRECGV